MCSLTWLGVKWRNRRPSAWNVSEVPSPSATWMYSMSSSELDSTPVTRPSNLSVSDSPPSPQARQATATASAANAA